MKMLTDKNGTILGVFEAYTKFTEAGSFNLYTSQNPSEGLVFGETSGAFARDGDAIAVSTS